MQKYRYVDVQLVENASDSQSDTQTTPDRFTCVDQLKILSQFYYRFIQLRLTKLTYQSHRI